MISLKGKTALITGSSRGIGQQIAIGLAELGCHIVIHGRTKNSCAKTFELLKKYPIHVYCVTGELSKDADIKSLIKQVDQLNIQIDILYNNAAIMSPYQENLWDHQWNHWMESFQVNVMAMYQLCAAIIPKMVENGFGRVINTTSGIMGQPELAPYGASKWAVNKLTDDIAVKLKDTGVRINTLDPGWIRTDLGGANADHAVEDVENNGPNGSFFSAINHN